MDIFASFRDHITELKPQISHPDLTSESFTSLSRVLDRILRSDSLEELPLRTMFSFNSGQRLPKLSEVNRWWKFDPKGKLVIEFLSTLEKITPSLDETPLQDIQFPPCGPVENINVDHAPADRFMDANNDRLLDFEFRPISDLGDQRETKGLPLDFVGNICLNRIFIEPWQDSDVEHALTGLDYLSNLENSRRTALRDAAQRLHISEHTWHTVLSNNDAARAWILSIQQQEELVEFFYGSLWLDLRIWTMVKQLKTVPFFKPDVIAMLNTLFPPALKDLPSKRVSEKSLHKYRSSFYRFMVSIEINGNSVIDGFIEKLSRPGTHHTWPDTRQTLKDYIALAESMIKDARDVHSISYFKNVPEDNVSQEESKRVSGVVSELGNRTSLSTSVDTSCIEIKRLSTKSSGQGEKTESAAASMKSSRRASNTSQERKYVPIPRSKISGRPLAPRISSQGDVDTIFQDTPPTPLYSNPRRPSDVSGRGIIETGSASARFRSGSYSRPLTPSTEQQKAHGRSSSTAKRIFYDVKMALPGTPELPSPDDGQGPDAYMTSAAFWEEPSSKNDNLIDEGPRYDNQAVKTKKPGFSFLRRKEKTGDRNVGPDKNDYVTERGEVETVRPYTAPKPVVPSRLHPEAHSLSDGRIVKKKSSFGFLQGHKIRDESHGFSDSNSERTITDSKAQPKFTLRSKGSLSRFFAEKEATSEDSFNSNDDHRNNGKAVGSATVRHPALRKARSESSVKSSSSAKSAEGMGYSSRARTATVNDEDRVITSADIAEPFPFGNFVQPQTPAVLLESTEDFKFIEDMRTDLMNKARKERMAKWEQSDEFRRKLEASREKRRMIRAESNPDSQLLKTPKQKKQEVKERQKEEKEKARARKEKQKEEERERKKGKQTAAKYDAQSPTSQRRPNDKAPKTPLKERIIKEIANAYSPTAR